MEVQIRITAPGKHLIAEGYVRQGKSLWVSEANAHQYVNVLHIAEYFGAAELTPPPAGPGETKPAGPGETKPAGPAEKKSSGDAPHGPATDSQSSNVAGTVQSSFLSGAGQASATRTSRGSRHGAPVERPPASGSGESSR